MPLPLLDVSQIDQAVDVMSFIHTQKMWGVALLQWTALLLPSWDNKNSTHSGRAGHKQTKTQKNLPPKKTKTPTNKQKKKTQKV